MFSNMEIHENRPQNLCMQGHEIFEPSEIIWSLQFCVHCRVLDAVLRLIKISSTLSFTDWGENGYFQMLSTGNLEAHGNATFLRDFLIPDPKKSQMSVSVQEYLAPSHTYIAIQICQICKGYDTFEDKISYIQHTVLGLDLDGILLILYRAIETNLSPGSVFVIRTGEYKIEGDRRSLLSERKVEKLSKPRRGQEFDTVRPWN